MTRVMSSNPRVGQKLPELTEQQLEKLEAKKQAEKKGGKGKSGEAEPKLPKDIGERTAGKDFKNLGEGASVKDKLQEKLQAVNKEIAQLQKGGVTEAEKGKLQTLLATKAELIDKLSKPALPIGVRIEKLEAKLKSIETQIAKLSDKPQLTDKEQGQLKHLKQQKAVLTKQLDLLKEKAGSDGASVRRRIDKLEVYERACKGQIQTLKAKGTLAPEEKKALQAVEAKYEKIQGRLLEVINDRIGQVDKHIQTVCAKKDMASSDTAELRKLVKERTGLAKKFDKVAGVKGDKGGAPVAESGAPQQEAQGAPGSEIGGGLPSGVGGGVAPGSNDGIGGGLPSGVGGGVAPGSAGGIGGPVSNAGGDPDSMLGAYAGKLEGMTGEIEALMAKGDLSEKDSRQLQWLMMKRSELSMLISQVMTACHESRKHIIQAIRA